MQGFHVWCTIFSYIEPYVPAALGRAFVKAMPFTSVQRIVSVVDVMDEHSRKVFHGKRAALETGDEKVSQQIGEGRDILSILSRLLRPIYLSIR